MAYDSDIDDRVDRFDSHRPVRLLTGFDSLYVSFYLDTATCRIDWEDLAYRKEKTRQDHGEQFNKLTLGTETFALRAYGRHPYKYVLSNKFFDIAIGERMRPACYVRFPSEALWSVGEPVLLRRFEDWCRSLRLVKIRYEVVNRVDWAFDFHLPIVDFAPDHFVSRATKDATWRQHGTTQTVKFGEGDVVVRIYDKVAEIAQQSAKVWFFDLWGQNENVWRVEFQVRRKRLKEAGINTLAELRIRQGNLLRELASTHTTLRIPTGDKNRSRWPLHPLWAELQASIGGMPQMGFLGNLNQQNSVDYRLDRLSKSLLGNLKGAAVLLYAKSGCRMIPDLETVLEELPGLFEPHHSPVSWESDVRKKIDAFELGQ